MSTAHRPTWTPAQGKTARGGSRVYSSRDMAAHTKLKFRQPGQDSTNEVQKRDLRAELMIAEQEAREKKRKAEGLPEEVRVVKSIEGGKDVGEGEEANKRRKVLQEALEMDRDDESEEEGKGEKKGADDDDDEEDDDDDDDDEDDTAELLRELEKIKRERAEEKARLDSESSASDAKAREEEIATGNPLLNLAAALGQTPVSNAPSQFTVKKRWDDDLVFKNQANGSNDKKANNFVNDLLRTEFHRKFMSKFIK